MFRGKGPGMIAGNFATNFPLKHQQKDMKYEVDTLYTTCGNNHYYIVPHIGWR
jgi:3-hydroxyisobutyrate dehydrogenase-like beta-hydroxyacid dehydrogenase